LFTQFVKAGSLEAIPQQAFAQNGTAPNKFSVTACQWCFLLVVRRPQFTRRSYLVISGVSLASTQVVYPSRTHPRRAPQAITWRVPQLRPKSRASDSHVVFSAILCVQVLTAHLPIGNELTGSSVKSAFWPFRAFPIGTDPHTERTMALHTWG